MKVGSISSSNNKYRMVSSCVFQSSLKWITMFICENVVALHYQMLFPLHICQYKRLFQLDCNLDISFPGRFSLLAEVRHDVFSGSVAQLWKISQKSGLLRVRKLICQICCCMYYAKGRGSLLYHFHNEWKNFFGHVPRKSYRPRFSSFHSSC